jgi:cellulose biosynthesis protein BcsQ
LHLACVWACQGRRVAVIDADPDACAVEWSELRAQETLPSRFTVIAIARDTLHRELAAVARDVDRAIVDGPSHIEPITRSALMAADFVLVPVQPPPFQGLAFVETLRLANGMMTVRPQLRIRLVLNRCKRRASVKRDLSQALGADKLDCRTCCLYRGHGKRPAPVRAAAQQGSRPRDRRARRRGRKDRVMTSSDPEHTNDLTQVELLWLKQRIENWIRFGRIADETIINSNRRVVSFSPGSIFAFVRWASNDYGTVASRINILRAITPGERYSTVPYVRPGAEILLRLAGWPKVEKVLHAIDAVEALGIDPADAAPEHWRHVHNRLSVSEAPRRYTQTRHQAWLHRRRVTL